MGSAAIGFCSGVRPSARECCGIGEGETAEFDFAARHGAFRDFCATIIDIGFGGKNVIQAAHGGCAALKDICNPAEGDHWPDELVKKAVERHECAQRSLAAEEVVAAFPQHDKET